MYHDVSSNAQSENLILERLFSHRSSYNGPMNSLTFDKWHYSSLEWLRAAVAYIRKKTSMNI